jgi:aminoglycoside phosphotransferase family enzyme/predicted kinase
MDLPDLIAALSDPAAYPDPPAAVEVRQTHISVVFLAGDRVYKVRKPVRFGFVDFGTLDLRCRDCDAEVRLNRRLAPGVYRGVVPITRDGDAVRIDGAGEVVEWAVEMVRLPDGATLARRLARGELDPARLSDLAKRVAEFHRTAERSERIAAFGRFEVVAGNARENFAQTAAHVGLTVSRPVYDRTRDLTEAHLTRLRPLIEARAERGVPCDTHGDLHLDHVYLFPDRPPPDDLVIIDCVEFNERFRFADPVADMAFLVMDLYAHGRPDLAAAFADAYFAAAGDAEGRELLPFYIAYRSVVRAKVKGIQIAEPGTPAGQRARLLPRTRAHWLLALSALEVPARRPCLVLVGGLPGTGKTTLARGLAERAGFIVFRSDVVRKELAGLPPEQPGPPELYAPDWTGRVYDECLRRAERSVFDGQRVIVDASFHREDDRRRFLDAARAWGVAGLFLHCDADPAVVADRLQRRRGDASDADERVYSQMSGRWEEPTGPTATVTRRIDTGAPSGELGNALAALRGEGLF